MAGKLLRSRMINPNSPAYKALLLQSAIDILKGNTMAKHARHAKMNDHNKPSTGNAFDLSVKDVVSGDKPAIKAKQIDEGGIDSTPNPGVQSGFSIFNPAAVAASTSKENTMAKAPKVVKTEMTDEEKASAAAAKANQKAQDEAAKAEVKAKREAAAAEKQAAAAAAKAEREAAAAARKAQREARIAELQASGKKYVGSMLALTDKVKSGHYVKSITGQLRSTDELATALDGVTPNGVIQLGMAVLKLDANPYAQLNVGQQSMNLRNRMRGALKKGTLTIATIKEYVAEHGLDVSTEIAAKKAQVAEAKAKKAVKSNAEQTEPATA